MASSECTKRSLELVPEDISLTCFGDLKPTQRSKRQGYRFFVQGYLRDVVVSSDGAETSVRARCYRSMRKNDVPHVLHICLNRSSGLVSFSKCSCTAGLSGRCSHLVGLIQALMHYQQWGMKEIPSDMSCTELQQRWGKPRGNKIRPDSVMALSCAKVKPYEKETSKPMAATVTNQRIQPVKPQNIQRLTVSLPGTAVAYLLNPDLPMEQTELGPGQTGSLLPYHLDKYMDRRPGTAVQPCGDTEFPLHTDGEATPVVPSQYIACNSVFPLTIDQARTLERKTVRQADTDLWYQSRKNRITASAFHRVVKRVKDFNDKFTQSVLSAPRSVSSVPCSYGTAHENIAKSRYCEVKPSVHLHDCGLCVSPSCSFLGATPDAKVCCGGVTGILEVKCPYAARDMTVEEAVHAQNKFCLCRVDGKFQLDREHDYYCQVQGQLMVTGAPFCDFVVYTKRDIHIERIFPDRCFQNVMMEKLASFYCKYALPLLQSNQRNSDSVPKPSSPTPQGE